MTNIRVTRLVFIALAGVAALGVTLGSARQQPTPAAASVQADEFAKLQAGPNKLTPEQVTALVAAGGNAPAGGRGGRGGD